MATPVGHALIGITLARCMGVRSPFGVAAAVVASGLPDLDVPFSMLVHRDPWKLHKNKKHGTHTLGFALTTGMLVGVAGLVSTGSADGERDLIADALAGALIVGSHLVLDKMPLPYFSLRKAKSRRRAVAVTAWNWSLDAAIYGFLAARMWPRGDAAPVAGQP